jgi:thiamine biosynthesis lipoprotein
MQSTVLSTIVSEDVNASPTLRIAPEPNGYRLSFKAMACSCEVRVEGTDETVATEMGLAVEAEAKRIESKFSRYREDNIVAQINRNSGHDVRVDPETAQLLDFASQFHEISGGRFDITSGVLRRIWRFDGSDNIPSDSQIKALRLFIGWRKVRWRNPVIRLKPGMEIDFGGIGKEYAVDSALAAAQKITKSPVLINFGGDLRVSGPHADGSRWRVAIESTDQLGTPAGMLEIAEGALATSGDARRFLVKNGVRYGHILNPLSGRPVTNAPRSVTVAAATCIEAGMLATLAVLHGRLAEKFLEREKIQAWFIR